MSVESIAQQVIRRPFAHNPNVAQHVEHLVARDMKIQAEKEGHKPTFPATEWITRSEASRRATFRRLYMTGMTAAQIAAQMGMGPKRLAELCKSEGLPSMHERRLALEGQDKKRRGRKVGDPRLLAVPNDYWIEAARQGMTLREAAAHVGASHGAAQRAEQRLGIRFRRLQDREKG